MAKTRTYAKKGAADREPAGAGAGAAAAAAAPQLPVDVSCASCEGKPNPASVFCIQDCEGLPVRPARPLPPRARRHT